jgi:hypothetical protein
MTPFEKWYGYKPSVLNFKIFGSHEWAHTPKEKQNKLQPTSQHYTLVGYKETSKVYCLYDPSTKKVIEQRDLVFDEVLSHGLLRSYPTLITKD